MKHLSTLLFWIRFFSSERTCYKDKFFLRAVINVKCNTRLCRRQPAAGRDLYEINFCSAIFRPPFFNCGDITRIEERNKKWPGSMRPLAEAIF